MGTPSPPLDELVTPVTRQEFEESIYRVMARVGLQTSSWKPGAVVRAIVTAVCVVLHGLSVVISLIARSGFLELATGNWLRICAYYDFGTSARPATFASGLVRVDNSAGGVYNEAPGDAHFVGGDGQEYVNIDPMVVAAFQAAVYVNVRATTAGRIGTAPAGTINRFGSNYPGLTVTNPTALVGENDEAEPLLIRRARANVASISPNGPRDAYETVAFAATRQNGESLGINRVRSVRGPGDGSMTLYAANASGSVPGAANDPATDLGALQVALTTLACPTGMTANAASGIPVAIDVNYHAWVYTTSGLTEAQAEQLIQDDLSLYLRTRNIGGDRISSTEGGVYLEKIRATIIAAIPDDAAFRCSLSVPSADIACERYSVPVAGTITGTVTLVDPNE